MKYLIATWDGGGATPPSLGVARLLVAGGHDVVVFGDPTLAADIRATGAAHRTWPTAPQRVSTALEDDVLKDWEARGPLGQVMRLQDRLIVGPAPLFAADIAAAIDEADAHGAPFDVILADGILLGALIGAEARGIPHAVLVTSCYIAPAKGRPPAGRFAPARGPFGRLRDRLGFAAGHAMWDRALRRVNAARSAHGLAALTHVWDQWDRADRVLVLTGSAYDDPPARGRNIRYVGPVLEDIPTDGGLALPPGDEPLVVVGLSSSFMDHEDLLRRIVDALGRIPVRAVVTTGPALDPRGFDPAPNVVVVRTASHTALFRDADLVVTHAGHGTVIKAIAAGVPMLCLPIGRDQPDNALRAQRHGVARVLSRASDAETIAAAVAAMLEDPSYRAAAERLGADVKAEMASGALLEELEALSAHDTRSVG